MAAKQAREIDERPGFVRVQALQRVFETEMCPARNEKTCDA
jgi:hypothetical protein